MTTMYRDVEAVTRLLKEKETDLELAAKIGQELLERNHKLDEKVANLEVQQLRANDLITQLHHELTVKSDLLHSYINDFSEQSDLLSPIEIMAFNADLMKRKVDDLKEDNRKLQEEATELARETYEFKEKEEKLVSDAVKHLSDTNLQLTSLKMEYQLKVEECLKQEEEITLLSAREVELQMEAKQCTIKNSEAVTKLQIHKETQEKLTVELRDFKEKYRELLNLLHDAQDEIRDLKQNQRSQHVEFGKSGITGISKSLNVIKDGKWQQ